MDEQIVCHRQLEPRSARPFGQIVVIEEPDPEPSVEPSDGVVNSPFHE